MDDTAKLVAVILLASFAIERVVAAISYCFDTADLYRSTDPDAPQRRTKHLRHLALTIIAGAIAAVAVWVADVRILRVLKPTQTNAIVDFWLTWLVLFAGAHRIREFLQGAEGGGESAPEAPAFRIHVDNNAEVRQVTRA